MKNSYLSTDFFKLIIIAIILFFSVFFLEASKVSWIEGYFGVLAVLYIWFCLEKKTSSDMLSPSVWLMIWFFIFFFLSPIPLIFGYSEFLSMPYYLVYIPSSMLLASSSFSFFLIAYYFIILNTKNIPKIKLYYVPKFKNKVFLLTVTLAAGVLISIQGEESTAISIQIFTGLLIPTLIIILSCDFLILTSKRGKIPTYLFSIPVIVLTLNRGEVIYSKENLVQLIVFPFVLGYLMSGIANLKKLIVFSLIGLFLFLLSFPIIETTRSMLKQHNKSISIIEAIEYNLSNYNPVRHIEYIAGRFLIIEAVAGLVANENLPHPNRPSEPSWLIKGPIIMNIPSALWQNKPEGLNQPTEVGRQLGVFKLDTESNLAITIFGHLLWGYGYIAIVPGMLFIGVFTAYVYIYFSRLNKKSFYYSIGYFACLLSFFRIESLFNSYITLPIRVILIVWLIRIINLIAHSPTLSKED